MVLLPAQLTPFSPSFQCCFKALALFCSRQALLLLVFKSYLSSLSPALQVWHVGFGLGVAKSADPSPSSILNPQKLQIEASFSVSHVLHNCFQMPFSLRSCRKTFIQLRKHLKPVGVKLKLKMELVLLHVLSSAGAQAVLHLLHHLNSSFQGDSLPYLLPLLPPW